MLLASPPPTGVGEQPRVLFEAGAVPPGRAQGDHFGHQVQGRAGHLRYRGRARGGEPRACVQASRRAVAQHSKFDKLCRLLLPAASQGRRFLPSACLQTRTSDVYGQQLACPKWLAGISRLCQTLDETAVQDAAELRVRRAPCFQIVQYLKSPGQFDGVGARPPHGVLLYGPPGTGKVSPPGTLPRSPASVLLRTSEQQPSCLLSPPAMYLIELLLGKKAVVRIESEVPP